MYRYDKEVRKRIVRMHLDEGRTIRSLANEYEVSEASIEMTEAEQAAVIMTISDAACEDVEDYAKELVALCEQYDEVSPSTRSAQKSYLAGIARMGTPSR